MLNNQIIKKIHLADGITEIKVYSPNIAAKAKPGQFIIFKIGVEGERVPLTIADTDSDGGVTVVVQSIGYSTTKLSDLNEGDVITDFVGPLGNPSLTDGSKRYAVIGGGLGCAIAYPQSKELKKLGANVDLICGFRTKDMVFWEEKMKAACDNITICTDDGSYGFKGFVTDALKSLIESGHKYDEVIAIGPLPMMRGICNLTKEYGIKTTVSMNTIMIDGTGMCGGCRLTVGGKPKFACVDGPDFDGHLVDFDEIIKRNKMYKEEETAAREKCCRLLNR